MKVAVLSILCMSVVLINNLLFVGAVLHSFNLLLIFVECCFFPCWNMGATMDYRIYRMGRSLFRKSGEIFFIRGLNITI